MPLIFLSTLSLRRATFFGCDYPLKFFISIHALLAESDGEMNNCIKAYRKFLSTLSLRRATVLSRAFCSSNIFLSTLSLRRATIVGGAGNNTIRISIHALLAESDSRQVFCFARQKNFYPRSPCGERLTLGGFWVLSIQIFLSTLSLRRATDARRVLGFVDPDISIHALLAESDIDPSVMQEIAQHFYPRSPCGERRASPKP